MRFKLQVVLTLLAVAVIGMILQGCASGVHVLGEISLSPTVTRKYVQIGSKGHDSARLTVIEAFDITLDAEGNPIAIKQGSDYEASTDGLIGKVLQGTGAAIAQGGGYAAGAYLLRPDNNNTTTNVSQSGGGGVGVSSSSSSSDQKQGQLQVQSSTNTNSNTTTSTGGGCPGNSCGQGGNGH